MAQYTIQTRCILTDPEIVRNKLTNLDIVFISKLSIKDIYYSSPEHIDPDLHTYEKIGEDLRIRIIDDTELLVQQHVDSLKHKRGFPSHDIYESVELFAGKKFDYKKAEDIAISKGFPEKLIEISKIREIYQKDSTKVFIDQIDLGIFVLEINNETEHEEDYDVIKENHLKLIGEIGIGNEKIISDGYTHRRITQHIKSDPDVKKAQLKKELEKLKKELREKEKASGEAFTDTGDGWHENPTYETIWNDILILNNRIIQISEEMNQLNQ